MRQIITMDWEHIGSRCIHYIYIYMPMSLHSETERIWVWVDRANQLRISHPSVAIGPEVPLLVFPMCNGCSE